MQCIYTLSVFTNINIMFEEKKILVSFVLLQSDFRIREMSQIVVEVVTFFWYCCF